jgi:hypothetical protein
MMRRAALTLALLFASSCAGQIGETSHGGPGSDVGSASSGSSSGAEGTSTPEHPACEQPTLRGSARESLRRLTKPELVSTLRDLLGADLLMKASDNIDLIPEEQSLRSEKNLEPLHSEAFFDAYSDLSDQLAGLVAGSPTDRARLGGSCFAQDPVAQTCLQAFVRDFGRKVYRRPLTSDEQARLVASAAKFAGQDVVYGLMFQLLQAPESIYHIESGTADTPTRIHLTSHEIASRISYETIGTMPDQTLASAADAGQLDTLDQVASQVKRLLVTPAARAKFRTFFEDWLQMGDIARPSMAVGVWANIALDGLDTELRDEMHDFIDFVVWTKNAAFDSFMTEPSAFPKSTRLSSIYEATGMSQGGQPVSTPFHPGIITRAGLIGTNSIRTPIIHRAVFLRRQILCDDIPPPPPSATAQKDAVVKTIDPTTLANYQFVTQVTSSGTCTACHSQINPMGFAFETFDQLGRRRTSESVLDDSGKVVATYPLPPANYHIEIEDSLPSDFTNVGDVVSTLAKSQKARACMAKNLVLHLERRSPDIQSDCAVADGFEALASNDTMLDAIAKTIASEDIFWRKPQ